MLSDLYRRLMETLSGGAEDSLWGGSTREDIKKAVPAGSKEQWFHRHLDDLPNAFLQSSSPEEILADLGRLSELGPRQAVAWGKYLPDREVSEYSVAARDDVSDGGFHRLAGALTSAGLEILSAEIHSLKDSMFLDKFYVQDPDYAAEPDPTRFDQVSQKLVDALQTPVHEPPTFRRVWGDTARKGSDLKPQPTKIRVDNSTSDRFTVLDVFAHDRPGLLYTIAKALHELGLSVQAARIGTYICLLYTSDAADE